LFETGYFVERGTELAMNQHLTGENYSLELRKEVLI
jgi:hypothetical protein